MSWIGYRNPIFPRILRMLALGSMLGLVTIESGATSVWMSVMEPQWRAAKGWPQSDFPTLFKPRAPWPEAAKVVSVVNFTLLFVLRSPDDEFKEALDGLRARGIALSIQAQPLTESQACGRATESFGPPFEMARAAQRLKKFGADLRYIMLDEPLYFGHQFAGQEGRIPCQFSIDKLASESARKLAPMFEAYPDVQVGDVEPIGGNGTPAAVWGHKILAWHRQFKEKTGHPITFFDADVIWSINGSLENFEKIVSILRTEPVSIGVIYHGLADARSNQEWEQQALMEARRAEIERGIYVDRVLFESWFDFPRDLSNENQAGTLTHLIKTYAADRNRRGHPVQAH